MVELHINEDVDGVQPTEAAVGEFPEGADAPGLVESLAAEGISGDRVSVLHGEEGLEAYKGRASRIARLFDDTDEETIESLEAGRVLVAVFEVTEDQSAEIEDLLHDLGAVHTRYFGTQTHTI